MKTFSEKTYRPLPIGVTVKPSKIDALGLHATVSLQAGTILGETHVLVHNRDRHEWVRTPLGGFINHSDDPNCETIKIGKYFYLITIKDIMPDEEITLKYTLYNVLVKN